MHFKRKKSRRQTQTRTTMYGNGKPQNWECPLVVKRSKESYYDEISDEPYTPPVKRKKKCRPAWHSEFTKKAHIRCRKCGKESTIEKASFFADYKIKWSFPIRCRDIHCWSMDIDIWECK